MRALRILCFLLCALAGGWVVQAQPAGVQAQVEEINTLIDTAISHETRADFKGALRFCHQALARARLHGLHHEEVMTIRILSGIYLLQNDYDRAEKIGLEALELGRGHGINKEVFKCAMNLGDIYLEQGNSKKASAFFLMALKLVREQDNQFAVGRLYNSLGNLDDKLKNYPKAINYYKKAAAIYYSNNEATALQRVLNDIGISYSNGQNTDSALVYYKKALAIKKETPLDKSLPSIYNNIGEVYNQRKEYKAALPYYKTAYSRIKPYGLKNLQALFVNNIAKTYLRLGNLKQASLYFDTALALGTQLGYDPSLVDTYGGLADLWYRLKSYEKAYQYQLKYLTLKDSLFNIESTRDINEKIIGYETEMKDKEIKILNIDKERREAETRRKLAYRNLIIVVVSALAAISVVLIALTGVQKRKRAQKAFLFQLIQSQEDERKRISKELHDGIGQSLMVIKNNMTDDKALIENTIEELRAISRNLHPIQLEKLGLKRAIESIVEEVAASAPIFFSHEIDDIDQVLTPEQQINTYRIVQECLTNIVKHAHATDARVTITHTGQRTIIAVYDNGIGFNPADSRRKKTLGLASIHERSKLMNGELAITSMPGHTKIEIKLRHA